MRRGDDTKMLRADRSNLKPRARNSRAAFVISLAWITMGALLVVAPIFARDKPPEVPLPKPIVLPTPQLRSLPNGLRLVVVERRSLPILTLRLVVRSGAESDPPGLPGTAQLTAEVLPQGTASRTANEIAEAVDSIGGDLSTGASWDYSYANLTVLSDHADFAFELLADIIRSPAFPPEEIERKQTQTISALDILRDDPGYMADAVFNVLVFKGTRYGHPLDGTAETIRKLDRRLLREFHRQHYRPGNCILAAVGDISADEVQAGAARFFGGWSAGQLDQAAAPTVPSREDRRSIVVIDKPDAVQTEIRVGNLAVRRRSPDYFALVAANQVLGGPAANRLFKTLRNRLGLTYGASSDLILRQTAGSWVVKTSTRTRETGRSLRVVLEELERLRASHPSFDELRTAKSFLIGHMALEFETSDDIAAQTLELLVHELPIDYWNAFPGKINALVAPEVSGVASRYLDGNRQVIVLVGNASHFTRDVRKIGPVQIVPLRDLDLASPDLRRPAGASGR
jgi:zinc protease